PARGNATRSLNGEDDLADVLRGLHQAVRFRRLGEGEGAVDHRLDAPRFDERPDLLAQVAGKISLELHRAWPQRRAGDGEPAAQHLVDVELAFRAAQESDEDEAAVVGE